jgi:hypothetical protein
VWQFFFLEPSHHQHSALYSAGSVFAPPLSFSFSFDMEQACLFWRLFRADNVIKMYMIAHMWAPCWMAQFSAYIICVFLFSSFSFCFRRIMWSRCLWLPICGHHVEWHIFPPNIVCLFCFVLFLLTSGSHWHWTVTDIKKGEFKVPCSYHVAELTLGCFKATPLRKLHWHAPQLCTPI